MVDNFNPPLKGVDTDEVGIGEMWINSCFAKSAFFTSLPPSAKPPPSKGD